MSSPEPSEKLVKPRPKLSDMPHHIKEMIAENTDVKTRYTLRKVSTHFRAAVDTSKFYFDNVKIAISHEGNVLLRLTPGTTFEYRNNGENGCVVKKEEDESEKVIEGVDFIQRAVDDLGIILKSPKIFSKGTIFGSSADHVGDRLKLLLREKLESFPHKLSIGCLAAFMCTNQDQLLKLLDVVKPGTLKILEAFSLTDNYDQIVETEHWPFLEEAYVGGVQGVPISKFLHLREFCIGAFPLTKDDVKEIVQSILQRPANFERYEFCTENEEISLIWDDAMSEYPSEQQIIPIPGTDYQLLIEHFDDMISFSRIDR